MVRKDRGHRATAASVAMRIQRAALALWAACCLIGTGAVTASAQTLPDGRGWEQVSPSSKDGASVLPLNFGILGATETGPTQAADDGNSVAYVANGPVEAEPEGNRAIEGTQVISTRTSTGWRSRDIVTPHNQGEGIEAGKDPEYRLFSSDLSLSIVQPHTYVTQHFQEPPLQPGVEREEVTVYRRHTTQCEAGPVGCFEPLLTAQNVTGTTGGKPTPFGRAADFLGSSPTLQQAVVASPLALAPVGNLTNPESFAALFEIDSTQPAAEQVRPVSVLPEENGNGCGAQTPPQACYAAAPLLGGTRADGNGDSVRGAVSTGGSRVFWSGVTEENAVEVRHLYVRNPRSGRTIRIDKASHVGEPKEEWDLTDIEPEMRFATEDGTRVFFTDTVPLTPTSRLKYKHTGEPGAADLYVCQLTTLTEGCKLTDLTAELGAKGGDVLGEAIGASGDGNAVYFAANGAPEPGGNRGNCESPNLQPGESPTGTCNLYVVKFENEQWQAPRLIAEVSGRDSTDWGRGAYGALGHLTARVSETGRYLAFMSERELTGFHNVDANPAASGAHDEEVYRYDSQAKQGIDSITCVSCNKDGRAPKGVLDPYPTGLVVDPGGQLWGGAGVAPPQWVAAVLAPWNSIGSADAPRQSRYLLNDGTVFFDSADPLTQEALQAAERREAAASAQKAPVPSGVMAVYENKPTGLEGCLEAEGCSGLLSGAEDPHESAFLDASESGDDAFFLTATQLSPTDTDTNYDIYDAHRCTSASPCIEPPSTSHEECSGESCRTQYPGAPGWASPNVTAGPQEGPRPLPSSQVLPSRTSKPLTAKQKLDRALRACRIKYRHNRRKRAVCEHRAHSAYTARRAASQRGRR